MKPLIGAVSILGLAGIFGITIAGLAVGNDNGGNEDQPVVSTPGPDQPGTPHNYDVLHRIRLEVADDLGLSPLDVRLSSLTTAGWDGCLGVIEEGQVCTEIFIGGMIAIFEAEGANYRYHIGGDRYVGPVEPTQADDGTPLEPATEPDRIAYLAEYARQELALRLDVEIDDLDTAFVIPTEFGDGCLGYVPDNARCAQFVRAEPGALVGVANGDVIELYSVTFNQVTWHDQAKGQTTVEVDPATVALQEQLRRDLAGRLGVELGEVGIGSFREVTWSDGCLGVINPATLCLAALTPGYLAFLTGPDGLSYRYHGGAETFIAVDFEEGISGVQEPVAGPG